MLSRKYRAAVLVVVAAVGLVTLVVLRPGSPPAEVVGQPAEKARSADETAIRNANAAYVAAIIAGDLDALMAFWAPDSDYIDEAGKMTRGKDEISALFKKALPELKGSKITVRIHSIKFLRPEICLVDGTLEITSPTGTKESSRYAVVWTRTGDKWLISSVRDLPAEVTDLPSIAAGQLQGLDWLVGDWADDGAKGM